MIPIGKRVPDGVEVDNGPAAKADALGYMVRRVRGRSGYCRAR